MGKGEEVEEEVNMEEVITEQEEVVADIKDMIMHLLSTLITKKTVWAKKTVCKVDKFQIKHTCKTEQNDCLTS